MEEKKRLSKKEKKELKYLRLKEKYKAVKRKRGAKKRAPENQEEARVRVCIEVLGGEELMTPKEMRSLASQVQYAYASNRVGRKPLKALLTNFSKVREYFSKDYGSWKNFGVMDESVEEIAKRENRAVVVLTADSENVLEEMDEETIYVIGGLVDRNRHKGYTEKKFSGVFRTARLPITQSLSSSSVLSTLHVFNILLAYAESKSWDEAIRKNIPERKQRQSGSEGSKGDEGGGEVGEGVKGKGGVDEGKGCELSDRDSENSPQDNNPHDNNSQDKNPHDNGKPEDKEDLTA